MSLPATCPRCGADLRPPGLMSSDWSCSSHGAVAPLHVHPRVTLDAVRAVAREARVPLWCPLPPPTGWTVTGLASCGDRRTGATASALALSGPNPLGGTADLVLVAEEPGTGLGARYAGTGGLDPGDALSGAPEAKVEASGHDTPLWRTRSAPDRVAFAGEASGVWLWAVLWPPAAELVLLEHVVLHDLRSDAHVGTHLELGAPGGRLAAPPPAPAAQG